MRTLRNSPKLRGLARNPALPPHLLDVFVANADDKLNPLLGYREDLSAKQLNVLAARAGGIPVALVELLDTLVQTEPLDDNFEQAEEVEEQPDVPAETLLRWLRDKNTRRDAARHPNLPPETIVQLLDDDNRQVVEAAAANPSLPVSVMADLLRSS
jgi:hypothetical protein